MIDNRTFSQGAQKASLSLLSPFLPLWQVLIECFFFLPHRIMMKPGGITFRTLISSPMLFTPTATTRPERNSLWQEVPSLQGSMETMLGSGVNDNQLSPQMQRFTLTSIFSFHFFFWFFSNCVRPSYFSGNTRVCLCFRHLTGRTSVQKFKGLFVLLFRFFFFW